MNKKVLFGSFLAVILIALLLLVSTSAIKLVSFEKISEEHKLKPDFSYTASDCLPGCMFCENIEFIVEGNDLTYYHFADGIYNCCAKMIVQLELEGSLIRFIDFEHFGEGGPCDCLCGCPGHPAQV